MIECKEDVVVWFRQLESYKRIDAMCTLMTSCLSFELRFLGTYLEDLASRDYEGLRSIELRVSNEPELIQNLSTCQQAMPTDQRVRRMMAMYLALIRNVNRKCCNELYKTLELWGRRDCMDKYLSQDELFVQELLLIYIMAKNHPVLGFEQRLRCAEVFQMLYEAIVIGADGGGGGGGDGAEGGSGSGEHESQQAEGNDCQSESSSSPSPTMPDYVQTQIHLQQKQQQFQSQQVPMTYSQPQQQLHGQHLHLIQTQSQPQHTPHPHHPHHVHQFLDSSSTQQQQSSHLYVAGQAQQQQHPQLMQAPTTSGVQFQTQQQTPGQVVVSAQQQSHIQIHPGHQLLAAYPQLIQTAEGLSQQQQQQSQQQQSQQPMGISMDQYQTVASLPQYLENPFLTAAGTTVSPAGTAQLPQQTMVQWPVTGYRHAAPTIDTSIPPPQIPILPQSSTSSSSSLIISQSSSPTQSRTTSPVRVIGNTGGGVGVASAGHRTTGGSIGAQQITTKRASRRPSADQTTPPPQGLEMMVNKTYDENPEILRNGYARQGRSGIGGGNRLEKTTYSVHHHQQQQQQQQQQQYQTHNFHVHPQYNFINHQLAQHHQQQQQQQQQQHQLMATGITTGLPHGLEYVTYGGKTSGIPATVSMQQSVPQQQQQTGSDSGSNSNDDCSPAETPTGTISGGIVGLVPQQQTSAIQSRLLNPQLVAATGTKGVVYVNSSQNVSPSPSSGPAANSSSNSSQANNNSSNSNNNLSNELSTSSTSPSPVSVVAVNHPYGKTLGGGVFARYVSQQQGHGGDLMGGVIAGQELLVGGGGGGDPSPQQVYAYNNHFVTHHHPHTQQQLHHHQQQQQQHHHSHPHMLRTTGAPSGIQVAQIQSPPPVVAGSAAAAVHIPVAMLQSSGGPQILTSAGGVGATSLQGHHPHLLNYPAAVSTQQQQQGVPQQVMAQQQTTGVGVGIGSGYVLVKSCFNCGSQAHSGLDCRETSMEDAIHHANYKLDYKTQQQQQLLLQAERGEIGEGGDAGDGDEGEAAVGGEVGPIGVADEDVVVVVAEEEEDDDDVQIIEIDDDVEEQPQQQQRLRSRLDNRGTADSAGGDLTQRFVTMALQSTTGESEGGSGTYRTQQGATGTTTSSSSSSSSQKGGKF